MGKKVDTSLTNDQIRDLLWPCGAHKPKGVIFYHPLNGKVQIIKKPIKLAQLEMFRKEGNNGSEDRQ